MSATVADHLLNGLYDAKLAHQPVVAIVGQRAMTALGGDYQHEVDLVSLLVGQGALHATNEVIETAEPLGAGGAKALLGKAALPDGLPYVTGSMGCWAPSPVGSHAGLRHASDDRLGREGSRSGQPVRQFV